MIVSEKFLLEIFELVVLAFCNFRRRSVLDMVKLLIENHPTRGSTQKAMLSNRAYHVLQAEPNGWATNKPIKSYLIKIAIL
jgi:hypothetical protein